MKGVISITNEIISDILNISSYEAENLDSYRKEGVLYICVTLKRKDTSCPQCSSSDLKIKEYKIRNIKHSMFQFDKAIIVYRARRYICSQCGKTFYEENPFVEEGVTISKLTVLNVLKELKETNATFASVARHNSISPTKVQEIFDRHVNIPRQTLTEILCIDEVYTEASTISKYSCLLLDFHTHRLLDVLPDRKKYTLLNYFERIKKEERDTVKYVIMDMYDTYRSVVRMRLPKAKIAADSFHIVMNYTKAVDKIRLRIQKKFKKGTDEYYLLKNFNWLLLIDEPKENEAKYNRKLKRYINYPQLLDLVLSISEELRIAYELKTEYLYLNRLCTYENIEKELTRHLDKMKISGIHEIMKFRKTMNNWFDEIINSFIRIGDRRLSNGIMESRNGIVKKIKNNANGYYNFKRFRNRALYVMNEDSKPNLAESSAPIRLKGHKRGKYKKKQKIDQSAKKRCHLQKVECSTHFYKPYKNLELSFYLQNPTIN